MMLLIICVDIEKSRWKFTSLRSTSICGFCHSLRVNILRCYCQKIKTPTTKMLFKNLCTELAIFVYHQVRLSRIIKGWWKVNKKYSGICSWRFLNALEYCLWQRVRHPQYFLMPYKQIERDPYVGATGFKMCVKTTFFNAFENNKVCFSHRSFLGHMTNFNSIPQCEYQLVI